MIRREPAARIAAIIGCAAFFESFARGVRRRVVSPVILEDPVPLGLVIGWPGPT